MEKERIIGILEFFRDADKLIADNNLTIQDLEDQHYNSASAIRITGMPGGKGVPSNPVEQMAVQSICQNAAQEISYLRTQNERMQQVKLEIRRSLDSLSYSQRTILMKFYIEGLYWAKIAMQMHFSVRQCKNIRNTALRNLAERFSHNAVIATYYFPEF